MNWLGMTYKREINNQKCFRPFLVQNIEQALEWTWKDGIWRTSGKKCKCGGVINKRRNMKLDKGHGMIAG